MILCDIDGVLAFGPYGDDTQPGQPIYSTFVSPLREIDAIRKAGIPFFIVTAKVEAEARQILSALGIGPSVDGIVGADRMFWPTLVAELSAGRLPRGVRKSVSRTILPDPSGAPVVMIEDRRANLEEMLSRRSIDLGILVPPPGPDRKNLSVWFDLGLALRLAQWAVEGELDPEVLEAEGVSVVPVGEGMELGQALDTRKLLELPVLPRDRLASPPPPLEPVGKFNASRRETISWVRTVRRWSRGLGRHRATPGPDR